MNKPPFHHNCRSGQVDEPEWALVPVSLGVRLKRFGLPHRAKPATVRTSLHYEAPRWVRELTTRGRYQPTDDRLRLIGEHQHALAAAYRLGAAAALWTLFREVRGA